PGEADGLHQLRYVDRRGRIRARWWAVRLPRLQPAQSLRSGKAGERTGGVWVRAELLHRVVYGPGHLRDAELRQRIPLPHGRSVPRLQLHRRAVRAHRRIAPLRLPGRELPLDTSVRGVLSVTIQLRGA